MTSAASSLRDISYIANLKKAEASWKRIIVLDAMFAFIKTNSIILRSGNILSQIHKAIFTSNDLKDKVKSRLCILFGFKNI